MNVIRPFFTLIIALLFLNGCGGDANVAGKKELQAPGENTQNQLPLGNNGNNEQNVAVELEQAMCDLFLYEEDFFRPASNRFTIPMQFEEVMRYGANPNDDTTGPNDLWGTDVSVATTILVEVASVSNPEQKLTQTENVSIARHVDGVGPDLQTWSFPEASDLLFDFDLQSLVGTRIRVTISATDTSSITHLGWSGASTVDNDCAASFTYRRGTQPLDGEY